MEDGTTGNQLKLWLNHRYEVPHSWYQHDLWCGRSGEVNILEGQGTFIERTRLYPIEGSQCSVVEHGQGRLEVGFIVGVVADERDLLQREPARIQTRFAVLQAARSTETQLAVVIPTLDRLFPAKH